MSIEKIGRGCVFAWGVVVAIKSFIVTFHSPLEPGEFQGDVLYILAFFLIMYAAEMGGEK